MQAHEIFHLLMVALLLLPVEPRGLSAGARRAVRRAAVAETAAAHRSRQVRGHGSGVILLAFLGRPLGHPPFFALRRAALALASEVARPPRRPSACAALFMDGNRSKLRPRGAELKQGFSGEFAIRYASRFGVRPLVETGASRDRDDLADAQLASRDVDCGAGFFCGVRCHVRDNTEPLGYGNKKVMPEVRLFVSR